MAIKKEDAACFQAHHRDAGTFFSGKPVNQSRAAGNVDDAEERPDAGLSRWRQCDPSVPWCACAWSIRTPDVSDPIFSRMSSSIHCGIWSMSFPAGPRPFHMEPVSQRMWKTTFSRLVVEHESILLLEAKLVSPNLPMDASQSGQSSVQVKTLQ